MSSFQAGGRSAQGKLGAVAEEQFDTTFSLNVRGTLLTAQKALPLFNDGGSIFMTGSNASLRRYPDWSVYAASKAVLPALARVWVSELRDRKIRVNVLTPGSGTSPMMESVLDPETKAAPPRSERVRAVMITARIRWPSFERTAR